MLKNKNCTYCGWKFPADFVKNVSEQSDTVFCENCGTEIANSNHISEEIIDSSQLKAKSKTKSTGKDKKNSKASRIYEKLKQEKDPIDRILDDADFPLIFKENFNLVICRIIFDSLSDLVDISLLKTRQIELSEDLTSKIENDLEPTMNMRINDGFLTNLHKIPRKVFENHLKRFQSKIKRKARFRNDFRVFLRWLIKMVYEILSYSSDPEDLPKMEQIILKDLKSFGLTQDSHINSLNEPPLFSNNIEQKISPLKPLKVQQINNIKDASLYLKNVIMTDLIEKNLTIEGYIPAKRVLIRSGHYSFMSVIKRNNLNYEDILKCADLKKKKKRKGKWAFLIYNHETGEALPEEEALQLVIEFFKNTLIPDLVRKKKIKKGETPKLREIDDSEYAGFKDLLKTGNLNLTYNKFLDKTGFEVNVDRNRWNFLIKDEKGNKLTSKLRTKVAANYLKEIIVPDLVKMGVIVLGETPFYDHLGENGYGGFLNHINYNDTLKEAGFDLNLNRGNWNFLDKDANGKIFSRDDQIDKATCYFLENVIPDLIKRGKIEEDQTPTREIIRTTRHKGFLDAVTDRRLTFNEILERAGFKLNYDPNKWRFLFFDEDGNPYSYKQTMKIASQYYKTKIIPDLISKKKLKIGHTPTKRILRQHGHMGLIDSLYDKKKILYNELVEAAGLNPNDLQDFQKIGTDFHTIAERIFLQYTRTRKCYSFNEIYPSPNSVFHKDKRSDNTIIIDENFNKLSDFTSNFLTKWKKIDVIHVDYFLGASTAIITNHCLRGYQGANRVLILVSLNALEPLPTPENVPFRKNVIVLDTKSFADFFGYQNKLRNKFLENVKLAQMATIHESLREKLEKRAVRSKSIINQKYKNSQSDFIEVLKKIGKLELVDGSSDGSRIIDYF
ncbi:MAG: hypothetical protein ACW98X_22295 [Promethearchaeota archaeon]|jgi:hypothetical protein